MAWSSRVAFTASMAAGVKYSSNEPSTACSPAGGQNRRAKGCEGLCVGDRACCAAAAVVPAWRSVERKAQGIHTLRLEVEDENRKFCWPRISRVERRNASEDSLLAEWAEGRNTQHTA